MAVTISDIARIANVSKATVSLVLNDKPGISESTRQRVLEIVANLNYRPSELARSLSNRRTRSIGLVIKEIDNPFFAKIMKGVYDVCVHHGFVEGPGRRAPQRIFEILEGKGLLRTDPSNAQVERETHEKLDSSDNWAADRG